MGQLQPMQQIHAQEEEQTNPQQSLRREEILAALQVAINELNSAVTTIKNEPADSLPEMNITVLSQHSRIVIFSNRNIFLEQVPNNQPIILPIVPGPSGVACSKCGGSGAEPKRS